MNWLPFRRREPPPDPAEARAALEQAERALLDAQRRQDRADLVTRGLDEKRRRNGIAEAIIRAAAARGA